MEFLHMTSLHTLTPTWNAASLTSEGKSEEEIVAMTVVDVGVAGPGAPSTKIV